MDSDPDLDDFVNPPPASKSHNTKKPSKPAAKPSVKPKKKTEVRVVTMEGSQTDNMESGEDSDSDVMESEVSMDFSAATNSSGYAADAGKPVWMIFRIFK